MLRLLLLTTTALAGCHIDLNDPGTDPPLTQFYYPVGLAYQAVPRMDGHLDRYLFVSNGNADLRYGGGLIQLVDVRRFECAVWKYCQSNACPDSLKIDPVCDDDSQVDADLAYQPTPGEPECQPDPLDPSVIDCDETPFILGNAGVRVGNFAGAIKLLNAVDPERLFVSVRGDPSVTWMNVHLDQVHMGQPVPSKILDCFDRTTTVPDNAVHAPGCDEDFTLFYFKCVPGTTLDCNVQYPSLPTEPFGMYLDTNGQAGGDPPAELLISSLATGQVTLIDPISNAPTMMIKDVSPPFFAADPSGRHGAFALAPQHPHDFTSPWYMTSDLQATISTFRVAKAGVIVPSVSFGIGSAFAVGSDVRDLVFEPPDPSLPGDPGGNRAFLTEANPPSVLVLDTAISQMRNPGQPLNQLKDVINTCQSPSHLGVRRGFVAGSDGSTRLQTNLYVVCFLEDQLQVVDPDAPGVLDTVLVGRGPNDVAFNFGDNGDPDAPAAPPSRRAFVTHYSEMSVGMIDLDPGSPTHDRMVARIGKPVPPPTP